VPSVESVSRWNFIGLCDGSIPDGTVASAFSASYQHLGLCPHTLYSTPKLGLLDCWIVVIVVILHSRCNRRDQQRQFRNTMLTLKVGMLNSFFLNIRSSFATSDVKRFPVYRLLFIFLVLVFEFPKPIIVSNLVLSSRLKDASPRSVAVGRLGSLTDTSRWSA